MGRVLYCWTMSAILSEWLFTKLFLPIFVFISLPAALETMIRFVSDSWLTKPCMIFHMLGLCPFLGSRFCSRIPVHCLSPLDPLPIYLNTHSTCHGHRSEVVYQFFSRFWPNPPCQSRSGSCISNTLLKALQILHSRFHHSLFSIQLQQRCVLYKPWPHLLQVHSSREKILCTNSLNSTSLLKNSFSPKSPNLLRAFL